MATPNIVNVTSIFGGTAYLVTNATTANTAWTYNGTNALTGLTPASGSVNKIENIVITNTQPSAITVSVSVGNNATYGSATVIAHLAYNISVPPNASLVVTDKSTSFYLMENQSVAVTAGVTTAGALTAIASFETITGPAT
jgi:hypothetical protein